MKRKFLILPLSLFALNFFSQVGINTTNPQATFQVVGVPNDSTKKDGIIAPRITANQLQLKTYGPEQIGALIYATEALTSASNSSDQTKNITKSGYFYFDGEFWQTWREPLRYVVERGNYSSRPISFMPASNNAGEIHGSNSKGRIGIKQSNYFFGDMNPLQTGSGNTGVGNQSMVYLTNGNGNSSFGDSALYQLTTGNENSALGYGAGFSLKSGSKNTYIGNNSGVYSEMGFRNTALGNRSLYYAINGNDNTALGFAAFSQRTTVGSYNVAIGAYAGSANFNSGVNKLGSHNVLIGTGAGFNNDNLSNKLIIHSNHTLPELASNGTFENANYYGNSSLSSLEKGLITGDFVERWVKLNGTLSVGASYMPNAQSDISFTKNIVAKADGTFGWENKTSIPVPPTTGNYVLKAVNGIMKWVAE